LNADGLIDRRGLAVADDSHHLLMGNTTGGVWVSADAGEYWQAVPQCLAPAFAERFG
jgi:photosystem II stability/assembly factor-like uncharacterized protein